MDSSSRPRSRLSRYARELRILSWRERRLLARAWFLLPLMALWIRVAGFRRVRAFLEGRSSIPEEPDEKQSPRHRLEEARTVARIITAAASHPLFSISCLPRSLTLWWILRQRGMDSEIRIGVRRQGELLEAHAWVEYQEVPLNDTPDVHRRYAAFDPIAWPQGATWV